MLNETSVKKTPKIHEFSMLIENRVCMNGRNLQNSLQRSISEILIFMSNFEYRGRKTLN